MKCFTKCARRSSGHEQDKNDDEAPALVTGSGPNLNKNRDINGLHHQLIEKIKSFLEDEGLSLLMGRRNKKEEVSASVFKAIVRR